MALAKELGLPILLADETLTSIGALASIYSVAELYAALAVWHALKLVSSDGLLVTTGMSIERRLSLVITVGPRDAITADDIEKLKGVKAEFGGDNGLAKQRNDMIHAVWATNDPELAGEPQPITFPRSGKAKVGTAVTPVTINETTLRIVNQVVILELMLKRWGALTRLEFD